MRPGLQMALGAAAYVVVVVALMVYLQGSTLGREAFGQVVYETDNSGTAIAYDPSNDINAKDLNVTGKVNITGPTGEPALMVDAQGQVVMDTTTVNTAQVVNLEIGSTATVAGKPVATIEDVKAIQRDIKGDPGPEGPQGPGGPPGNRGPQGPPGPPGYSDKTPAFDSVTLGNKFRFSGVGDAHANDDWLRMFNKEGTGYNGGIAMSKLWVGNSTYLNGDTNLRGGTSVHNPGNWQTHFPWAGDNKNYIRGDTEIRGNTNNIGDLYVGGKIHLYGDPAKTGGWNSGDNSDPYSLQKIHTGPDQSHLRLTLNDNSDESLQIWGNSCGTGNCGGPGQKAHQFTADGTLYSKGNAWIGDNLILGADNGNRWIVHSPNDSRRTLYVAPWKNGDWSWGDQVRIESDGTMYAKRVCTNTRCY